VMLMLKKKHSNRTCTAFSPDARNRMVGFKPWEARLFVHYINGQIYSRDMHPPSDR
jgi:hypothetical protein